MVVHVRGMVTWIDMINHLIRQQTNNMYFKINRFIIFMQIKKMQVNIYILKSYSLIFERVIYMTLYTLHFLMPIR